MIEHGYKLYEKEHPEEGHYYLDMKMYEHLVSKGVEFTILCKALYAAGEWVDVKHE